MRHATALPHRLPTAALPSIALVAIGLLAIGLLGLPAVAAPTGKPAFTDPAHTDADFPFQGEYAGTIAVGGEAGPVGVQVIALGDGAFDVVAYPGGLPGDGWSPPDKIQGRGVREGDGQAAGVKVEALDLGGTLRRGRIKDGALVVLSESGAELARLPKAARTSPTLGDPPPPGAVQIFSGLDGNRDISRLAEARVSEDGLLMEGATTKDSFGDAVWHIEFRLPYQPQDRGQGRGNSGAYVQGAYEVQMLDSFGLDGKSNECGGIYSVAAPFVNMCLPPLAWQTYDIDFKAATYDGDEQVQPARMTVRHNGVVIHDAVEVAKTTPGGKPGPAPGRGPLHLQNHGNPVRYRNIWVLPKP
ncbi:MAG: hypothetical protein RLZZ111_700 [Planctomycetota bacterium]|jgi:hypothetical protein